jgi:hypothetical protein
VIFLNNVFVQVHLQLRLDFQVLEFLLATTQLMFLRFCLMELLRQHQFLKLFALVAT